MGIWLFHSCLYLPPCISSCSLYQKVLCSSPQCSMVSGQLHCQLCLICVEPSVSYGLWFAGLLSILAFALIGSFSKSEDTEKAIRTAWKGQRIISRATTASLFISYVVYTHLHNQTIEDRVLNIVILICTAIVGVFLDIRCSKNQLLPFIPKLK